MLKIILSFQIDFGYTKHQRIVFKNYFFITVLKNNYPIRPKFNHGMC